jgi:hypothetical protein
MPWSIVADVIVGALLVTTLIYVHRLSGRLATIRAGRAEFEKLVADLAKSTDQAASHLHQFKMTAEITGGDLQARVERTQKLAGEFGKISEDLKALTERAEGAANRLEAAIARTRPTVAATNAAPTPSPISVSAPRVEDLVEDDDNRSVANLSALSGLR